MLRGCCESLDTSLTCSDAGALASGRKESPPGFTGGLIGSGEFEVLNVSREGDVSQGSPFAGLTRTVSTFDRYRLIEPNGSAELSCRTTCSGSSESQRSARPFFEKIPDVVSSGCTRIAS